MVSKRHLIFILIISLFILVPSTGLSCEEEKNLEETTPPDRMGLSSTLVPDTDFDLYVYIKQESPTVVFKDVIGTPFDIEVVSMSIWGIATEETYALSGGLEFTSTAEATDMYSQVESVTDIWTSLSQETIYFAHGSGNVVNTFTSTISSNIFKYYDDEDAMAELAYFPDSSTTILTGIAIVKPSPTLVNVIVRNTTSDTAALLNVIFNTANLQIITTGLYSQHQINVSAIMENPELTNILASQVGILTSAKSALPGLVVGPIVKTALENTGYEEIIEGEFSVYKGYLALGLDNDIPVFFRVEDNRLFAAVSLQESYARLLINNIIK